MNYERLKYLRPLWPPLLTLITKRKDNYNKENENIIKRVGEKKKIKNSNQYTMGIYGVFCWFYTCFEQKSNPKMVIYIITIAGLFSRKMAHILNQLYVDRLVSQSVTM